MVENLRYLHELSIEDLVKEYENDKKEIEDRYSIGLSFDIGKIKLTKTWGFPSSRENYTL
jgi:hypothetical protein